MWLQGINSITMQWINNEKELNQHFNDHDSNKVTYCIDENLANNHIIASNHIGKRNSISHFRNGWPQSLEWQSKFWSIPLSHTIMVFPITFKE